MSKAVKNPQAPSRSRPLYDALMREYRLISGVTRSLARVGNIQPTRMLTVGDVLEKAVDDYADKIAFQFEGRSLTYRQFDDLANRYAHWAVDLGLKRGDSVALFMGNCPDYVAIWVGLLKAGMVVALINSNLIGQALAHCVDISNADHVIVEAELAPAMTSAKHLLTRKVTIWSCLGESPDLESLDTKIAQSSPARLPPSHRAGMMARDLALLIYTSGTTGAPKAARMPHWRVLGMMRGFIEGTNARPGDRVYLCLPLYHSTGGLCGIGIALLRGGTVVLRRRFSATHFWPEIVAERCTIFVYIGELCRYLVNQPVHPQETHHQLRVGFGNGLRPEVWENFQPRFRIPRLFEFYGSTEGNVALMNFDGKIGAVGRVPFYLQSRFNVRIVRFDVETETPIRGADGLCQLAAANEVGEAIGEIQEKEVRYRYEGYSGDKAQTEKKILRDVLKKGDAWFRTGDLMRRDKQGYFYFVDRIGDTFRWKSENVSTGEVGEALASFPGIAEANVYGVPIAGLDGKAGMASIVADQGLDWAALKRHLDEHLPSFARPLFLRLQPAQEITGTFKYRKIDLVKQGFDPDAIADPILFNDPEAGQFRPLDAATYARIQKGEVRL